MRLQSQLKLPITQKWDELSNQRITIECEELVLRNTFVNAQMGPLADLRILSGEANTQDDPPSQGIRWLDNHENDKVRLVTNKSEDDLIYKEEVSKIDNHRVKFAKSIMKPFQLNMSEVTGIQGLTSSRQLTGAGVIASQSSHRHTFSEADAVLG
jgi:hypothetical protein